MTDNVRPLRGCPCGHPTGPKCPDCQEHERDERAKRLKARIDRSELPTQLRGLSVAAAVEGPATDAAARWARGDLPGLCLTGPVGVGKSWLAAAAAWERLQTYGVRWVSAARLMAQIRSGFNSKAKARADEIITGTCAIVLDDLDKVNPTEYGREVMFAAIDGRVEEGAPLLVTTNKAMSEIGEQLGDAIMSRLAGYCQVVRMVGDDRRVA
jgi:DNA replication protein DnaC